MSCHAYFPGRRGISYPRAESTLPHAKFWDEDKEEEVISFLMVGSTEPVVIEDPYLTMEDIFGDLNSRGHQTNITSWEATKKEGEESKTFMVEKLL